MKQLFVTALLCAASLNANALCIQIENLKGKSISPSESEISDDGYTGQTFMMEITDKSVRLTPNDDSMCRFSLRNGALCFYVNKQEELTRVDTWTFYPEEKKALLTITRSVSSIFPGVKIMQGDMSYCGNNGILEDVE